MNRGGVEIKWYMKHHLAPLFRWNDDNSRIPRWIKVTWLGSQENVEGRWGGDTLCLLNHGSTPLGLFVVSNSRWLAFGAPTQNWSGIYFRRFDFIDEIAVHYKFKGFPFRMFYLPQCQRSRLLVIGDIFSALEIQDQKYNLTFAHQTMRWYLHKIPNI